MGIGWRRYARTVKYDREFRSEVNGLDELLIEPIVALRRKAAIDLEDPDAQEFLINRYDKSKQFAATMRLKRKELKLAESQMAKADVESTREALGLSQPKPPESR